MFSCIVKYWMDIVAMVPPRPGQPQSPASPPAMTFAALVVIVESEIREEVTKWIVPFLAIFLRFFRILVELTSITRSTLHWRHIRSIDVLL